MRSAQSRRMSSTDDKRPQSAASRLKELRLRAGLSMSEMAKAMGYKTASGYQRLEDETAYWGPELPLNIVRQIARVLIGKGAIPIGMKHLIPFVGFEQYSDVDPVTLHRLFKLPVGDMSGLSRVIGAGGLIAVKGTIDGDFHISDSEFYDIEVDGRMDSFGQTRGNLGIGPDVRFVENEQIAFEILDENKSLIEAKSNYIICITDGKRSRPIVVDFKNYVVVLRIKRKEFNISIRSVWRYKGRDSGLLVLHNPSATEDKSDMICIKHIAPFVLHTQQFFDEIEPDTGEILGRVRLLGKAIGKYGDLGVT